MAVVAVVNFGTGNLRSVQRAVERVADKRTRVVVTDDCSYLKRADRVVLPGQGAIGSCLAAMKTIGLRDVLDEVLKSKPVLGICLGLQVMYDRSEEGGGVECVGVLRGNVERFGGNGGDLVDAATGLRLKVPHMGWNNVRQTRPHPLWRGIGQGERFYFVHSYCAHAADAAQEFGVADYGGPFTAAGGMENFFGTQFHPEKSQHAGLRLMRNFIEWNGSL